MLKTRLTEFYKANWLNDGGVTGKLCEVGLGGLAFSVVDRLAKEAVQSQCESAGVSEERLEQLLHWFGATLQPWMHALFPDNGDWID
jgi:hypothetical protein